MSLSTQTVTRAVMKPSLELETRQTNLERSNLALHSANTHSGSKDISTPAEDGERAIEMRNLGCTEDSLPPGAESNVITNDNMSTHSVSLLKKDRIYLAVLSWCFFTEGWHDGTLGPLLPRMQSHYHIGFTIVSLLFVTNCLCCVFGALTSGYLGDKVGFGKIVTASAAVQIIVYAAMATAPPFPVLCIMYGINGFVRTIQDTQGNAFMASIPRNTSVNMGILHASYGLGAVVAPLVATQFAQLPRWSFHFLISMGLAIPNTALLATTFRFKRQQAFIPPTDNPAEIISENKYKRIMSQKLVHYLGAFSLVYVGVEVTIGGWIVTFIMNVRKGGASSGYVSSGFFGGLTLGRVALLWVNKTVGERRVIYLYSVLAIGLELVIWFVPNLIGNAIAVALVGMLLGPCYPICLNVAGSLLPQSILVGSIGWIAGLGQTGAAMFPFITGAMASKHGVQVLQPLILAMLAFLIVLWALVTRSKPTRPE